MSTQRSRWITATALAAGLSLAGAAAVGALPFNATTSGQGGGETEAGDDANEAPDVPITGAALEAASAAALDYTGEGRVTDTEVDDEESYYEVEVTLDDGREIDVQLDESFTVVGTD